jgi:protein NRD1
VDYDNTLPNGHIKVLSRTLFVGGVTCSEAELRSIFSRFGEVQTCIVNKEKRHAFVKMYSRKDAVNAKEAMEDTRNLELPLRTRWGVGFGPRDCSDYQTGISVIPISKLTEADRKWMLTAPYGGSGGKPIVSGLVVEEPDIEIGAGVSSKAISRRMQTDKGGSTGPKSSRRDSDEGTGHHGGRHGRRRDNRRDDDRGDKSVDGQPAVPDFPFGLAMAPNGMPIFPPGFSFPAPGAQGNAHGGY